MTRLSLAEALRDDRMAEFVAQEEKRGVGPATEPDFDRLAARLIQSERSADQTSGSPRRGGSAGK